MGTGGRTTAAAAGGGLGAEALLTQAALLGATIVVNLEVVGYVGNQKRKRKFTLCLKFVKGVGWRTQFHPRSNTLTIFGPNRLTSSFPLLFELRVGTGEAPMTVPPAETRAEAAYRKQLR